MGLDYSPMIADFFRLMNLNGAAHVYREAVRAGVLDALREGPRSAGQIAETCQLAERPVGLLLEALAMLGVVAPAGPKYELTLVAMALLSGSYRHLGDQYWAHLPALLATGKPLVKMDSTEESEEHYKAQAEALAWMSAPAAEAAARLLDAPGTLVNAAILDVGAGSAIWSLTLAKQAPGAMVTAIDWPGVLTVAEGTAKRLRIKDRLRALPGNYHEVALAASAFDLAVAANVTHLETAEGNRALFEKLRTALKPGGRLVIIDVFPGQSAGDLNRALYALGLALRTERAQVHSREALEGLLREAGFGGFQMLPLDTAPHAVGMLVAT